LPVSETLRAEGALRQSVAPSPLVGGLPPLERGIELLLVLCAALSIVTTLGIIGVLAVEAVEFLREVSIGALLFDTQWTPLFPEKHFGIWPLLCGTAVTSGIAMLVAVPLGLLSAIYLSEYASPAQRRVLKPSLELLAGVPTIVYGYFALVTVTPFLQRIIPGVGGFNGLSAGLVMGVMITPLVASLTEDALFAVPRSLREAAYALGAAKTQTILRVVLPAAMSGISASIILALSRAVGETMVVAIAAGQQPQLTLDPRGSLETMTTYIVQVSMGDTPTGTIEYRTIFAIGSVLFITTLGMNILSYCMARSFREGKV
jgi:phosphate transport system permease protein